MYISSLRTCCFYVLSEISVLYVEDYLNILIDNLISSVMFLQHLMLLLRLQSLRWVSKSNFFLKLNVISVDVPLYLVRMAAWFKLTMMQ